MPSCACADRCAPCLALTGTVHSLDQHLRDLGPREFRRWQPTCRQHSAYRCATQGHLVLQAMGTGLGRGHPGTAPTVERVLELERHDAKLVRRELVEKPLRIIGAVVRAYAGMITAHANVRPAV